MRTTISLTTALLAAALLSVVPGPARAETRTFTPPEPTSYLKSATVTSTPKAWRFVVRTKKPAQVRHYEIHLDTAGAHGHPGADIMVSLNGDDLRIFRLTGKKVTRGYAVTCGATSKPLVGEPGRVFRLPQRCVTYYETDDFTVERLRARFAVVGVEPDGSSLGACSTSWSPGPGRLRFHPWVANTAQHPAGDAGSADYLDGVKPFSSTC